jgi:hypothetical protein
VRGKRKKEKKERKQTSYIHTSKAASTSKDFMYDISDTL